MSGAQSAEATVSPEGAFCIVDGAGRFLHASEPFLRLWGMGRASDLRGRVLGDLFDEPPAALTEAVESGVPWRGPILGRRREGQPVEARLSIEPLYDLDGQVAFRLAVFDPSAEARLGAADERLQQAVRVSQIGIFDHDHVIGTVYCNATQRSSYGWTPDEAVTIAKVLEAVHPEDRERIGRAVRAAHDPEGDGLFDVDYRIVRPNGEVRWHTTRSQTFFAGTGGERRPVRTVGAALDITEIKRQEHERERLIEELEVRNAELERFTYTVSHDLRSPLITVRGFVGLLERDAAAGRTEEARVHATRIVAATDRLQRLLQELLDLSRVGRVVGEIESVPFAEVAREAIAAVDGALREKRVALDIAENLPVVRGDRARLVEVLQNLVENAAKFMGEQPQPHVEIGWRPAETGDGAFFVRDNGIGIPSRHAGKVFGLFEKLDAESEGSGVGLALVKRIVEVHGGRIWVESGEGQGACILFTLPLAGAEVVSPTEH
jgi:PAS domain S-box-containing protein